MSKFLLNLLLQISKALVNSKIQFFNLEILFLDFGLADLAAHLASQPSQPVFNGIKAINAGINHPGHPSPALPRPL
jgi:hypothetical protein